MVRLGVWAAAGLGMLCSVAAHADTPVERGKVFTGPEGIRVEVVPLKPASGNKVLLRFVGIGGPWEGKVLLHELEEHSGRADFHTQNKGRGWNSLAARTGGWSSSKTYSLYFPGGRDGVQVSYDDAATKALNSEDVARTYELLQKSGELTELMNFNRKEYEAEAEKYWADDVKATNDKCGTAITARIDWKSVSEDLILKDNLSIPGYCGAALEGIRTTCGDEIGKAAVKAGIKVVACNFGKAAALTLDKGTLGYTTSKDASNQADFAHVFLEKKL
jgi:hypothetical protein